MNKKYSFICDFVFPEDIGDYDAARFLSEHIINLVLSDELMDMIEVEYTGDSVDQ